jgi:perosamine synthetase
VKSSFGIKRGLRLNAAPRLEQRRQVAIRIACQRALPVFVDVDPATFQIAADKVEAAITERTTAILPVHLGGNVADMDKLLEISRRRNIPIVEDACQSHLAEWRGRKVGTLGATGCFSFQASKNLNSGEGGAILTNDPDLAERCYGFHNNGRGRGTPGAKKTHLGGRAANLRLTEFQATLLMTQMERLEAQARARERNAGRLTRLLKEIPGVRPAEQYEGCTRNAYHLYMFRVDSEAFGGLSRDGFLRALRAEGIPCSGGYGPMQRDPFIRETLKGKGYRRIFPAEVLDGWEERNQCPENDQLCREAVWFTQTMLLGPESDMDQIADAVRKIQRHGAELARA